MRLPALLLLRRQRLRKIARPVAPQQLGQARVVKAGFGLCQLRRAHRAQLVQAVAIAVADKAGVQVLLWVGGRSRLGLAGKHRLPQHAHIRQVARNSGVRQRGIHVDVPALRHRRGQGFQIAHHHWRFVQMDGFDRQALDALGQIGAAGEHAQAQLLGAQSRQLARVLRQIPGDDFVLVGRVAGQWPHHRQAAALGTKHARDVQKRPCVGGDGWQVQFGGDAVFFVQRQRKVKQLGLVLAHQTRQRNRRAHV